MFLLCYSETLNHAAQGLCVTARVTHGTRLYNSGWVHTMDSTAGVVLLLVVIGSLILSGDQFYACVSQLNAVTYTIECCNLHCKHRTVSELNAKASRIL